MIRLVLLAAAFAFVSSGCASRPLPFASEALRCTEEQQIAASLFLLGDAGEASLAAADAGEASLARTEEDRALLVDPVLVALRAEVDRRVPSLGGERVAVVYLGDNIYPEGLVPVLQHEERARGEAALDAQIMAGGGAEVFFVLGNHDWGEADPVDARGRDRALEQGRYLAAHPAGPTLLPKAGCAGPETVDLGRSLRLVFIDPMGWLLTASEPQSVPEWCEHRDFEDVTSALRQVFREAGDRRVVLLMHHPQRTAGPHGGHFTLKQHIFPLTDFWRSAWIPLPLLGSAYPLVRLLGITNTDVTHPDYQRLVEAQRSAQRPGSPVLIASGHEHSLQVHREPGGLIHAVSGAASVAKLTRVEAMDELLMAVSAPGYMRLDEFADGALRLSVVAVSLDAHAREIFHTCVLEGQRS